MGRHIDIPLEVTEKIEKILHHMPDSKLQFKLLAILKSREKKIGEVADFFNIHYITLSKWIKAFMKDGVEGLMPKPKGHKKSHLTEEEWASVLQSIEGEEKEGKPYHWTLEKMRTYIQEKYGVKIVESGIWYQLQKRLERHKSVRPTHGKKPSTEVWEAFKKNKKSG